jgi:hypothetical protein
MPRLKRLGKPTLACAVMVASLAGFADAGLFANLAIGTTAYLLSLVAMRALKLRGGLPSLDL